MSDREKIGTWPTPEKPFDFDIPVDLLREFEKDVRIVIKHPYLIGIPVPWFFLEKLHKDPQLAEKLTAKFDIMFVPK